MTLTEATDADLKQLAGRDDLTALTLAGTQVTDVGLSARCRSAVFDYMHTRIQLPLCRMGSRRGGGRSRTKL